MYGDIQNCAPVLSTPADQLLHRWWAAGVEGTYKSCVNFCHLAFLVLYPVTAIHIYSVTLPLLSRI